MFEGEAPYLEPRQGQFPPVWLTDRIKENASPRELGMTAIKLSPLGAINDGIRYRDASIMESEQHRHGDAAINALGSILSMIPKR